MILARYKNDKIAYRLDDEGVVSYQFKNELDRIYSIKFHTQELANQYYIEKTGSSIPKIERMWSYYGIYMKISFGDTYRYYRVDDNWDGIVVLEVKYNNGNWDIIEELRSDNYIVNIILLKYREHKEKEEELRRLRLADSVRVEELSAEERLRDLEREIEDREHIEFMMRYGD